jgi:hypothetical protein
LNKIEKAMKTQNSINNIDKNNILSSAEKAFERILNIILETQLQIKTQKLNHLKALRRSVLNQAFKGEL